MGGHRPPSAWISPSSLRDWTASGGDGKGQGPSVESFPSLLCVFLPSAPSVLQLLKQAVQSRAPLPLSLLQRGYPTSKPSATWFRFAGKLCR